MPRKVPSSRLKRVVDLDEAGVEPGGGELLLAEDPREEPALVAPLLELDQDRRPGWASAIKPWDSSGRLSLRLRHQPVQAVAQGAEPDELVALEVALPKAVLDHIARCSSSMPEARLYWSRKSGKSLQSMPKFTR